MLRPLELKLVPKILTIAWSLPCLSPPWTEWWCLWPAVVWPWILLSLLGPLYGRHGWRSKTVVSFPPSLSRVSGGTWHLVTDEKTLLGSVITDCLLVSWENTSLHFMTENMMLRYSSRSYNNDPIHRCKSFNYIEQYRRKGWYSNMYCPDPEEPYWHN